MASIPPEVGNVLPASGPEFSSIVCFMSAISQWRKQAQATKVRPALSSDLSLTRRNVLATAGDFVG
jgi:hypothetical protein